MAITTAEMRGDDDWKEAWAYGGARAYHDGPGSPTRCEGASCSEEPVSASDIVKVIAASEGENDERDWVAVVKLKDGRYAFVEAGCDYTGWDCWSQGQVWVSDSLENLWQFGVTQDARDRLGDSPTGGTD